MPTGRKTSKDTGPTRVTLKFLADYLNLSPTTVSVVLTNSPLAKTIANPTKDRIWEAVRKFQYCGSGPRNRRRIFGHADQRNRKQTGRSEIQLFCREPPFRAAAD